MSIYVETRIRGNLEDLWQKSQHPLCHQRWDLRFTEIDYLPKSDESEPQRFRYSTRIGFGLAIDGEGESVASCVDGNRRTSSLRFWSGDPKSLIREGAGYWQYVPTSEGIRFLTRYDYKTRFGWLGRTIDRMAFRPLLSWATAWSFDRLRLWIEKGIDPGISMRNSAIHVISRAVVGVIWIYQGLVPKIIGRSSDELVMLADAGIPVALSTSALIMIGLVEVLFGIAVIACYRQRWPLILTVWLMVVATAGVILNSPRYLTAAFNPVSLNLLLATVALVGTLVMDELPSASNCLRKMPEATP